MTSSTWTRNVFQHPSSEVDYLQIHPSPRGKSSSAAGELWRGDLLPVCFFVFFLFRVGSIVSQALGYSPNNIQEKQGSGFTSLGERRRECWCFVSILNAELRGKLPLLTTNKCTRWSFKSPFSHKMPATALMNRDRDVRGKAMHESHPFCLTQNMKLKLKFTPHLVYPQLMVSEEIPANQSSAQTPVAPPRHCFVL